MNHEFQPRKKRGRNRYVGSWQEAGWREIALPFNASNLAVLLEQAAGILPADFTHQDFAHWCDCYSMAPRTDKFQLSSEQADRKASRVAEDVSAQWDLFLSNTFTRPQLQALNFSEVRLPSEWFHDWLRHTYELRSNGNA